MALRRAVTGGRDFGLPPSYGEDITGPYDSSRDNNSKARRSHPWWQLGRRYPHLAGPLAVAQLTVVFLAAAWLVYMLSHRLFGGNAAGGGDGAPPQNRTQSGPATTTIDTLVVYIFSNSDEEYPRNLFYFIEHGLRKPDDPCHYVIVVQNGAGSPLIELPKLPTTAWYEFHDNVCFDWGTIGWLMRSGRVNFHNYKYFIFMNSSVRGPFTPSYYRGSHWSRIFTNMINDQVKLVGPSISCEGAPRSGDPALEWRHNPHVQSYVLATDQAGLEAMQGNGQVFACYESLHDTIFFSELGASQAILDAGYNLASLMQRYQGIDWRDRQHWGCNGRFTPYTENHYDGVSLDPFEVVFVKVKSFLLNLHWSSSSKAARYDGWARERAAAAATGRPIDVTSNAWTQLGSRFRLPHMLALQTVGGTCFDPDFYLAKNHDLQHVQYPRELMFQHFANDGQFEGRPFRFYPDCVMDYEKAVWKLTNNKLAIFDRGE